MGDNDNKMSNFIPLPNLSPDDEHRCGGSTTLYKVSRRIHLVRETTQLRYVVSIQDIPLLTNCAILSASGHGNSVNHLSDNLLKLYTQMSKQISHITGRNTILTHSRKASRFLPCSAVKDKLITIIHSEAVTRMST